MSEQRPHTYVSSLEALHRRKGAKWSRHGPDVLPAWVADMDFEVAAPIRRALVEAVTSSDLGYPDMVGRGGVPELFAKRMAERFSWSVDPSMVLITSDVVQGIYVALQTLTAPGDGVLVQTPIYPPFLQAVTETGRRLLSNPLIAGQDRYEIDPGGWGSLEGARLLLLCNPHNPTGRVFDRAELATLAELVLERDLLIVADEIHADLSYPGHRHIPFASLGSEVEARTVTLTSATKAFNIAGLRCAVAAFGSQELLERFQRVPAHVRGGVGALALLATATAWRHAEGWLEGVMEQLTANRELLGRLIPELLPEVGYHRPEATYLAWLDCRGLGPGPATGAAGVTPSEDPWQYFLKWAQVATSNGTDFGPPGAGHIRLNFATSPAILTKILEQMGASLHR